MQRGGRQSQIPVRVSSRPNPDRHEAAIPQEHLTAPRRNRPLSITSTNCRASAAVEAQNKKSMAAVSKLQDYQDADKDQEPITPHPPIDEQESQRMVITSFGDEMYDVFCSKISTGKVIWTKFTSILHPYFLKRSPKGPTYKRYQFLRSRGIHGGSAKDTSRAEFLTALLFRKEHIAARQSTREEYPSPGTTMK